VRLLLDTVTFIWAVNSPERISKKALGALQADKTRREISVISLSEIAIKQVKGKLAFRKEDVLTAIGDLHLSVLPYAATHACQLFSLPLHHSDPFDRQLIAQALVENIPVVTCDQVFKLYKGIKIIW